MINDAVKSYLEVMFKDYLDDEFINIDGERIYISVIKKRMLEKFRNQWTRDENIVKPMMMMNSAEKIPWDIFNRCIVEKVRTPSIDDLIEKIPQPDKECSVCMEEFNDIRKKQCCVPCGHTNICSVCSGALTACPICNTTASQFINIY